MQKTRWIHLKDYDIEDAEEIIADLSHTFKKLNIDMKISESSSMKRFELTYDKEDIKKKLSRGAGTHRKITNSYITVGEARNRMKGGESAEKIANELGISRATFFRRLKELGDMDNFVI